MFLSPFTSFSQVGPWQTLRRLQDELDRVISWDRFPSASDVPAMNVWAGKESARVVTELPGVNAADIDISLHNDVLTVKGSRVETDLKKGETVHRRERFTGSFVRSIRLPFRADADHVDASYDKGILTVTLKRRAEDQPRRITVAANAGKESRS